MLQKIENKGSGLSYEKVSRERWKISEIPRNILQQKVRHWGGMQWERRQGYSASSKGILNPMLNNLNFMQ